MNLNFGDGENPYGIEYGGENDNTNLERNRIPHRSGNRMD